MGKGILFGKSIPFPIPHPLQKLWVEGRIKKNILTTANIANI